MYVWTHQARAVNRRGLRTQKTRLQRLCREVFAQTIDADFTILASARKDLAHTAGRMITCILALSNFASTCGLIAIFATGPQAFPKADRHYLPPRLEAVASGARPLSTPRAL